MSSISPNHVLRKMLALTTPEQALSLRGPLDRMTSPKTFVLYYMSWQCLLSRKV